MSTNISASKAKRLAAKKEKEAKKKGIDTSKKVELDVHGNVIVDEKLANEERADEVKRLADQLDATGLSDRITTGVLSSVPSSRDVKVSDLLLCSVTWPV